MKLSKGVLEPALTSYPTNDFGASFSRLPRPPRLGRGERQCVPVFELSDDDDWMTELDYIKSPVIYFKETVKSFFHDCSN